MFEVNKKSLKSVETHVQIRQKLVSSVLSLSANKSVNSEIQFIWSQWENSIFLQTSDCLDEVDFKTL